LDRLQRLSFSQELQNDPDVVVTVTLIKRIDYKNIRGMAAV
jgi:hypothetical protein